MALVSTSSTCANTQRYVLSSPDIRLRLTKPYYHLSAIESGAHDGSAHFAMLRRHRPALLQPAHRRAWAFAFLLLHYVLLIKPFLLSSGTSPKFGPHSRKTVGHSAPSIAHVGLVPGGRGLAGELWTHVFVRLILGTLPPPQPPALLQRPRLRLRPTLLYLEDRRLVMPALDTCIQSTKRDALPEASREESREPGPRLTRSGFDVVHFLFWAMDFGAQYCRHIGLSFWFHGALKQSVALLFLIQSFPLAVFVHFLSRHSFCLSHLNPRIRYPFIVNLHQTYNALFD